MRLAFLLQAFFYTFFIVFLNNTIAYGMPYTPENSSAIVEKLPGRANIPELKKTDRLKKQLLLSPEKDEIALALSQAYFDAAMATGDPRYIGYARAVFEARQKKHLNDPNWWFMSGLLKQYEHLFPEAHTDFNQALQLDKDHVQSWAWKAALWMVEGKFKQAKEACDQMKNHTSKLAYTGCAEFARAGFGQLAPAYQTLKTEYERSKNTPLNMQLWVLTRLAEMAERLGKTADAERYYRQSLKLGINDQYLLAAYSDFLLRQKRPKDVLVLLQNWESSDVLLLRLALATQQLHDPKYDKYRDTLKERFNAVNARGEQLHEQEEARFLLFIENKPTQALQKALHNYNVKFQREPRDIEILLQSAIAAHSNKSANVVQAWFKETGFEDQRLNPLLEQIKGSAQ